MTAETTITEIAPDTFRISTFHPEFGIQFNQFLMRDDEPFLMHTGFRRSFRTTLDAVSRLLEPSRLRWIGYSHFEPDECGALNEWLGVAPHAQAICGQVGALAMLSDYAERPPRVLADGEALSTGCHRLRYFATPHVPHGWDAGLFFDEVSHTLFCSDLFFQPGNPGPVRDSGIVDAARDAIEASLAGPLAKDMPYTPYTDATLARLADLRPATLATMHGASFRGDGRTALLGLADTVRELLGR